MVTIRIRIEKLMHMVPAMWVVSMSTLLLLNKSHQFAYKLNSSNAKKKSFAAIYVVFSV
jgi:hypothetical protein